MAFHYRYFLFSIENDSSSNVCVLTNILQEIVVSFFYFDS